MNLLKLCRKVVVAIAFTGASSIVVAGGGGEKEESPNSVVAEAVINLLSLPAYVQIEKRTEYVTDFDLVAILEAEKLAAVHEGGDEDEDIIEDEEIESATEVTMVSMVALRDLSLKTTLVNPSPNKDICYWAELPSNTEHPAHCFYGDWNTEHPNPYKHDVRPDETTIYLKLRDTLAHCEYHHPFPGKITSRYGPRRGRAHKGIDIDLEVWDPVHAAFAGQVRLAKVYGGYGRVVVIRHYNGLETTYAHLHRFKVEVGDFVEAGDIIGLGGNSGRSTGSHLHFEVRFMGIPINPESIIDFENKQLKGDVVVLNKVKGSSQQSVNSAVLAEGGVVYHRVQKGEYLYAIARKYGVSVDRICKLNRISKNATLRVGQQLKISA